MSIKVKKNLQGLFLHQNTPFELFEEKHIRNKFFLNYSNKHCYGISAASLNQMLFSNQTIKESSIVKTMYTVEAKWKIRMDLDIKTQFSEVLFHLFFAKQLPLN